MKYFTQLFRGLRVNWHSRSFPIAFFTRIYLFTVMTTVGIWLDSKARLPLVIKDLDMMIFGAILQMIYIIGTCVCFPFEQYKYNIILIVTETSLTFFMVLSASSKRSGGLGQGIEDILLYQILGVFICCCIISIGKCDVFINIGGIISISYKQALSKSKINSKDFNLR